MRKRVQAIAISLSVPGARQGVSPLEYMLIVTIVTLMTLTRYHA